MGQLQHGVYDDECEGLTPEEINAFYGFDEDGGLQGGDEDSDRSDEEEEEDSGDNYVESEADMELDEPGSGDVTDPDHGFDMEVRPL
jgi:hypothetical protein